MKKLFYTAALMGAMAMPFSAALADHHKGDYKGKMMEKVDTNGDGMISKEEFMARHEEQFAKMDADGDGNLTKDEMHSAREKMMDKWKDKKKKMESDSGY